MEAPNAMVLIIPKPFPQWLLRRQSDCYLLSESRTISSSDSMILISSVFFSRYTDLPEDHQVYMHSPPAERKGFWLLKKNLCGLKQTSIVFNGHLDKTLLKLGFIRTVNTLRYPRRDGKTTHFISPKETANTLHYPRRDGKHTPLTPQGR